MRIWLVQGLLALLFITACTQGPRWPEADSNADANIQLAQDIFVAFNKHDWVAVAGYYSNPAEILDPSVGSDYVEKKHEEMIAKYAATEGVFPDIQREIVGIHAGKNMVTVEFVSTGTGPDGKIWKLPACTVLTIRDGKVVRDATYYDLPR